ncbi:phosphoenolpyruvate--protein phosphotransferase, partial [Candidatus Sumerlaeota bacterium]|nr:phosphoenolpyruvate--protein phosphotransferase [Candidatus Sumerlaeota bacterium]
VIDVGNRICKHLAKSYTISPAKEKETSHTSDMIIFAHDLSPSDTAQMDHRIVKAFAMEIGGPTSHTAILAKGLEIPAVVGLGPVLEHVGPETTAIVDGYEGTVIVHPTAEEIRRARDRRRRHLAQERTLNKLATLPAETLDGYRVELSANLELPDEIPHAVAHGADGVGLFRTEFLYFNEAGLPEEDRQFDLYKNVLKKFSPRSVIFRTLDIGGDKFLADFPGVAAGEEANPFLGLRAIRFCLRHPGIFRTQLRAILRASAFGRARIMFPMVSSAEEVRAAKKILEGVKKELADEGKTFDAGLEVGIMVEIPSAALIADQLAIEADFFSIGTNDLIQYTLAVDRANERVASLYDPYHPAVLRLIRRIIDAAHRAGIWVGVCGEMASNPRTALLLVGMGIDELSMGALSIPEIKHLLRNTRLSEARRVASEIYALGSSEEIRTRVEEAYQSLRKVRGRGPDGNGTA